MQPMDQSNSQLRVIIFTCHKMLCDGKEEVAGSVNCGWLEDARGVTTERHKRDCTEDRREAHKGNIVKQQNRTMTVI